MSSNVAEPGGINFWDAYTWLYDVPNTDTKFSSPVVGGGFDNLIISSCFFIVISTTFVTADEEDNEEIIEPVNFGFVDTDVFTTDTAFNVTCG